MFPFHQRNSEAPFPVISVSPGEVRVKWQERNLGQFQELGILWV
jgi:hypothetical protein